MSRSLSPHRLGKGGWESSPRSFNLAARRSPSERSLMENHRDRVAGKTPSRQNCRGSSLGKTPPRQRRRSKDHRGNATAPKSPGKLPRKNATTTTPPEQGPPKTPSHPDHRGSATAPKLPDKNRRGEWEGLMRLILMRGSHLSNVREGKKEFF